jgi:uncharacterized membrane protein
MTTLMNRAAKSARRSAALALLGVLCLAGIVAYAESGRPDFNIGASPSTVSVPQGQTATYSIQLARVNGFTDSVALAISSALPPGVKATFSPNPIPAVASGMPSNAATLTLQTNVESVTPMGTYAVSVTAKGGNPSLSRSATVTLEVQDESRPNFTMRASPSMQFIAQKDEAVYKLTITRSGGFDREVVLTAAGLPDRTTAVFTPNPLPATATQATLRVSSAANAQEGSYTLQARGTGLIGTVSTTRFASLGLNVEKTKTLQVSGDLPADLGPGDEQSLDLSLENPHNFPVRIYDISVAIEEGTSAPACSGGRNYRVHQIAASRYQPGLWIPANSTRTLSQLGVAEADQPRIEMLNLPEDQDACKDAELALQYVGTATK